MNNTTITEGKNQPTVAQGEEVGKGSIKFLTLIEKIISEHVIIFCTKITEKLQSESLNTDIPRLIESAATTAEIRVACYLAPEGSMLKCEALSKWDRLAWIEAIQARTLEESLIAFFYSPPGSIAKEIAFKNSIKFMTADS